VVAARIGPGGEGLVVRWPWVARTWVDGRPGPPLRMRTGCAALAAWPSMGAGSRARVPVGWLGARDGTGAPKSPQVRPGPVAGVMPEQGGPGGDDHAPWSLCWCWVCVVQLRRAHPVRRGQAAAAARPRYVRRAVARELT